MNAFFHWYTYKHKTVIALYVAFAVVISSVCTSVLFAKDLDWLTQFGTNASDAIEAVATDGNTYITGRTDGVFSGEKTAGGTDTFVSKRDATGSVLWTEQFGSPGTDNGLGITVDAAGFVYVVGTTDDAFPGQVNAGSNDVFAYQFDSAGVPQWADQFGTTGYDSAYGVAVDTSGNWYIAGTTTGAFSTYTNAGSTDGFIRKYDSTGVAQWTVQFGTSGADVIADIQFYQGNLYLAGSTDGQFAGQTQVGGTDAFVAQYDLDGVEQWVEQFGTTSTDEATSVSADEFGVYVGGLVAGSLPGQTSAGSTDAFVAKYNTAGVLQWASQSGTSGAEAVASISADTYGVYLAGSTDGAFTGFSSAGSTDVFVQKYTHAGTPVWVYQTGSPGSDEATGIGVDDENVLIAGTTAGTLPGQSSIGGADGFLANVHEDIDDDGIFGEVDTQSTVASSAFSDGTTNGSIVTTGNQELLIRDAEAVADGVIVTASESGGLLPATVSACILGTYLLDAGDSVVITCGSVITQVISGPIEVEYTGANSETITATIQTGNGLTFNDDTQTFSAPVSNTQTIELTVDGQTITVEPGDEEVPVETGAPECDGELATVYVNGNMIVGGPLNGTVYEGVLKGTNDDDVIVGTAGDDLIRGKRGDDIICAGAGNDVVKGGRGDDTLFGEAGDDIIKANRGTDILYGGTGNDTLKGNRGTDVLYGEAGDDTLNGGRGDDILHGGTGNDFVRGARGKDTLYGNEDHDVLCGNKGDDTLTGGTGDDKIDGGTGPDTITGEGGTDTCADADSMSCETTVSSIAECHPNLTVEDDADDIEDEDEEDDTE